MTSQRYLHRLVAKCPIAIIVVINLLWLVILGGALSAATIARSPQAQDARTLLYLSFDNTLTGAQGETPAQASGVSFESGVKGQGVLVDGADVLNYLSANKFKTAEGTIEFWIKPRWNGNNNAGHFFFSIGNDLVLVKDGGNNFRFVFKNDDSEGNQGYNLNSWKADQWHHVAVTWKIPGTMKTYFDGVERISHVSSQQDLITALPSLLSIGHKNNSTQANAVFDELIISDIQRSAEEIASRYLQNISISTWSLTPATTSIEMYPGWYYWVPLTIQAATNIGNISLPLTAASWSATNPSVVTVNSAGRIKGLAAGTSALTAMFNGQSSTIQVNILQPARAVVEETIDPFLATPAAGYVWKMPVVIFRYFPTRDGVNVDAQASGYTSTLAAVKSQMDKTVKQHKFMLEEGSRFHGYKDPTAPPSLGYQVVKIYTVYEDTPPGFPTPTPGVYFPDYSQILERFGGENFVNNLGVKEFWIEHYHYGRIAPNESNMSSPLTGDISNSYRTQGDLPIYKNTYMFYGINFTRSNNEATHNHGHQLEAILSYANQRQDNNTNIFWKQFSGQNSNGSFQQGRCGNTHYPPNATGDYDYDNPTSVLSDCEDWTPTNTGQKKFVNNQTWRSIPYKWPAGIDPQNTESHWYIYWMQNMPGLSNRILNGNGQMTNWWAFTGDWDGSIKNGLGLYSLPTTSTSVSSASYALSSALSVESIASVFGNNLAVYNLGNSSVPLPETLGGTKVFVRDSAGVERAAALFYVSPTQVNYQIPPGTALGAATITVVSGNGRYATETVQIVRTAPGLFSAAANGRGLAAANVQRIRADGTQVFEPVTQFDSARGEIVAVPIDLSTASDRVYLNLYGTGIRKVSSLSQVKVKVGGIEITLDYAGPQGVFVGLDQLNVRLPQTLTGRGLVTIEVVVEGQMANPIMVYIR